MKKLLVTGGTGFIGSHTCLKLLEIGYEVVIIDSLINSKIKVINDICEIFSSGSKKTFQKIRFFNCDLRDESCLFDVFKKESKDTNPIDAVIHFAGLKSVTESISEPIKYWDCNVNGTLNLIKVMRFFECRKLLFSSSATIYSNNNNNDKFSEDSDINPISPYGDTKKAIENILTSLSKSSNYKWKIAILRYFNPIGAHPSGLIGDNPVGTATNIIPIINQVASGQKKYLEIFGRNWETLDGTGVRDYIHVMDIADGHLKTLEYLINNETNFITLNLGTGKGASVLQLLKTYEKINNVKVPYKFVPRRTGDVGFSVADNSLAKSLLNWVPLRDLNSMCADSWNWYRKTNNL